MFRFIHSADWQLGARFSQFGSSGGRLREARLETLKRCLRLAGKHEADAFLIAGDLFEDNQVDDTLVRSALDLFRAHPSLPIYILPGNHDPFTGPDSRLARYILNQAEIHTLGLAWFFARHFTRGRFFHACIVMDDPAHELDQTSFRDLFRLWELVNILHRATLWRLSF